MLMMAEPMAAGVPLPVVAAEPVNSDAVEFGVAHPTAIASAASFLVETWVYRQDERDEAEKRALKAAGDGASFRSGGAARVERGAKITVTVRVGDWLVEPARQTVEWSGDIAHVGFRVTPSGALPSGKIDGECQLLIGGVRIGFVPFQIEVSRDKSGPIRVTPGTTVKSAFASYASRDRRRVLARIQGIEKAGIDVYMDVRDLRAGSNYNLELLNRIDGADVLYLFWSRHAAASEWVEREWRHGFKTRGVAFIDPVPMVDPRKVPPPAELGADKHFNDWTLAYAEYEHAAGGRLQRLLNWLTGSE